MEHILRKRYDQHQGLDFKNSDLTRPENFASTMKNAQQRKSGSIEKRKGYQAVMASVGGFGLFTYPRRNPTTGADETMKLTVDQDVYRIDKATFTVTYSGLSTNCQISIYLDTTSTAQYRCQIMEGTTLVLDQALGLGFDEASPFTVNQLKTAINALTGFAAVIVGSTSVPAAFLEIVRSFDLVASALTVKGEYSTRINSTVSHPLTNFYAARNADEFENASAITMNNCIYIASGYDETLKYDGQTVYRAGLPTPLVPTSAVGAAGAITGNNYVHKIQYTQLDAAGNLIEGNLTPSAVLAGVAAQKITVTVPNVLAASGFNTNCAIVAGAQAAVHTITVDDGSAGLHTMQVGDSAYFFDSVSAGYVTRTITAISSTTITVDGAAVTVADNAVISNNLKIAVWRNKTSGTSTPTAFYLIVELPNNSFAATQTYTDNTADPSVGELLQIPVTDRSPPVKARYIAQWNGVMVLAGKIDDSNTVFFSDIENPEYHPADSNSFIVESGSGDKISGIAPNNEVFTVHGETSFAVVSGDITTGELRVEIKARDIGCVAHATLQDINGVLVWLSNRGPRCSSGGSLPKPLGAADGAGGETASRIDPIFDDEGAISSAALKPKRSISINDTSGEKYILFVPAETGSTTNYANSNSRTFAYDYTRDAWYEWNNLNMAGGACTMQGDLYFQERRLSAFALGTTFILYRRHKLNDAYDYADHNLPIGGTLDDAWEYSAQWDALGEPSVLKQYLVLKVFQLDEIANNDYDITVVQEINYQKDADKTTFVLSVPGSGYGELAYGDSPYGSPAENTASHPLYRGRVRSSRFRFRNSELHQNVVITGWEVECATPFRPEFKP